MRKRTIVGLIVIAAALLVLALFYGPAIIGTGEDTSVTQAELASPPASPADMAPKMPTRGPE